MLLYRFHTAMCKYLFASWFYLMAGLLLVLVATSCQTVEPEVEPAAFLIIDSISIAGLTDADIQDVWVEQGAKAVGGFELPAVIPIVPDGTQRFRIRPGIISEGLSARRVAYPFYEPLDTTIAMEPGSRYKINPVLKPDTTVNIFLVEDFEDSDLTYSSTDTSYKLERVASSAVNRTNGGQYVGRVLVPADSASVLLSIESKTSLRIPRQDRVFLEFNYNCTHRMTVGLESRVGGLVVNIADLVLRPTNGEWKKIYANLGEEVNEAYGRAGQDTDLKVFIGLDAVGEGTKREFLFDNMRLLHF